MNVVPESLGVRTDTKAETGTLALGGGGRRRVFHDGSRSLMVGRKEVGESVEG
jgi:hypothetical protein